MAEHSSNTVLRLAEAITKSHSLIPSMPMAAQSPTLVKPDGSPLVLPSPSTISRVAAKTKGSMRNWNPLSINGELQDMERRTIVDRSADLISNDPNAAGVVENLATTIVGTGLYPHPNFDPDSLGMSDDIAEKVKDQMMDVVKVWAPFADAGYRMSFSGCQFLAQRQIVSHGEFLFLVVMDTEPARPYFLSVQAINPKRLKTPRDLSNKNNIIDGVEIGPRGKPIAYWIKRNEAGIQRIADTKNNFVRISARKGHRLKVLHGFPMNESEQFRGIPLFGPGMKFFRDLSDYLDAELVANVVTAAFAVFIETGGMSALTQAEKMATITETGYKSDGSTYDQRYEEIEPGMVLYGKQGEKPHPISADRPGRTFDIFIRTILKSIANSAGIPYPVLFRDFEGMNFASYRSAMLEAWRVFKTRRKWLGEQFCAPLYRMLIEEAWLRDEIDVTDFYRDMFRLTSADWIGPPKGQIEPVKDIQADVMAVDNNFKALEEVLLESGREIRPTLKKIQAEKKAQKEMKIEPVKNQQVNADLEDKGESDNGSD